MNLAKYISWEFLASVGVGLFFGAGAYNRTSDLFVACLVFTAVQYTVLNFTYLARIERHLQELALASRLHMDMEKLLSVLQKARKEAEEHADRDR
jgi:hypothetical protein